MDKEHPVNINWHVDTSHQRPRVSAFLPQLHDDQTQPCPGSAPLLHRASPRCTFEITILSPKQTAIVSTQRPSMFPPSTKGYSHQAKKTKGWKLFHKYHDGKRGGVEAERSFPALSLPPKRSNSALQGPFWITDRFSSILNDHNNSFLICGTEIKIIPIPYRAAVRIKLDYRRESSL